MYSRSSHSPLSQRNDSGNHNQPLPMFRDIQFHLRSSGYSSEVLSFSTQSKGSTDNSTKDEIHCCNTM